MDPKTTRSPQGLFLLMRKHPYLLTILICFLLLPFGFADRGNITAASCVYLGVILGAVAAGAIFFFNLGKTLAEKAILSGISLAVIAAGMLIIGYVDNKAVAAAVIALTLTVAIALFIRLSFDLNDTTVIALLIFLGITIRFVYVLYTSWEERQHDVGFFNWEWGHANYIEYWYNNGLKLPDFDVTLIWQYYHPPFHHWLMALLLRVLTTLGVDYSVACEGLQILPMLYSSLIIIVSYRIFRLVKLSGKPLMAATALVCFHPTFILFAGEYNNDILLTLMVMSAILWELRWYRKPVWENIIPLAFCIGLGMMTKLSGWMVAPAAAFLFLVVLIKNIRKPLKYIGQYAVFGSVCAPLGLWWPIRNLIKFNIPLTYVPFLNPEIPMYSGNMPLSERFLNFGGMQLSYVYDALTDLGAPYDEFNPTYGLFKTAMFDEGNNAVTAEHFPQITVTAPILYWISVVLFVTCFVCFVIMMIKKSRMMTGIERGYFALLMGVQLVCYYWFCIAYPFTCTMNIRYCMPVIPLCALGMALLLQHTKDNKKPAVLWFRRTMYALTAAFCFMSCLVYTQIGTSFYETLYH